MLLLCRLPRVKLNVQRFYEFFVLLARNFEFTKTLVSRFWLPTTAAWRTQRPRTPYQERASFSRAVVACEEL